MYLFKYLLDLNDESIEDINTSLNAISVISMLTDQYKIENLIKRKEKLNNDDDNSGKSGNELIMDEHVTLILPKHKRKMEQRKYYRFYQQSMSENHVSLNKPHQESITDAQEFLNFFDELYKNSKDADSLI